MDLLLGEAEEKLWEETHGEIFWEHTECKALFPLGEIFSYCHPIFPAQTSDDLQSVGPPR